MDNWHFVNALGQFDSDKQVAVCFGSQKTHSIWHIGVNDYDDIEIEPDFNYSNSRTMTVGEMINQLKQFSPSLRITFRSSYWSADFAGTIAENPQDGDIEIRL